MDTLRDITLNTITDDKNLKCALEQLNLVRVKVLLVVAEDVFVATITDGDVRRAILAGGLGTRLYPYTKILPKPLIPVADTPIAERIIQSFQRVGCEEFHMIVNYKRSMIKAYFNDADRDYNIHFWDEEEPLGTGGGLYF